MDRDTKAWMPESLPLNHIVLCLAKVTVLRTKERCEVEKVAAKALEDARRMHKRRRNGCRMQNGSDPCAT